MPPRADLDCAADASLAIDATTSTQSKPHLRPSSSKSKKRRSSLRERRRPRIAFRNTHGITGLASTFLTCLAIGTHHVLLPLPPSRSSTTLTIATLTTTSILAAIASIVTAYSGISIVDQAPKQTVVMEYPFRVIPPHRDAFRRTAYSIYYLCARICWNANVPRLIMHYRIFIDDSNYSTTYTDHRVGDWIWGIGCMYYATKNFIPHPIRHVDLSNGNTWVFVIPMAAGLTADALFQLPAFQCIGTTTTTTNNDNIKMCWNDDAITQLDLLWVLLSGLVVAFVFTLAFRGVFRIQTCYWGAALVVHGIVAHLIGKALPFVKMAMSPR